MSNKDKDNFEKKGPTHLVEPGVFDWSNSCHTISALASLIRGVKALHNDRKKQRHGSEAQAPLWYTSFGYEIHEIIDDRSSIFGAIYIHKLTNTSNSSAPLCVVAFRGTILSSLRDLTYDMSILLNDLHKTPRAKKAIEAVRGAVEEFGRENVWIAGHSLGAAIAFVVGKNMIRNDAVFLKNTFLFNPPFRQVEDHCTFAALAPWRPHLFVNSYDLICSGYIEYFERWQKMEERRQKMEEAGAWTWESENVAMQHSGIGLASQAMGQESRETMHLLPLAYLKKNSNPSRKLWTNTNHGIRQWWSPHLRIETETYTHTPTHDNYCAPSCILNYQDDVGQTDSIGHMQ